MTAWEMSEKSRYANSTNWLACQPPFFLHLSQRSSNSHRMLWLKQVMVIWAKISQGSSCYHHFGDLSFHKRHKSLIITALGPHRISFSKLAMFSQEKRALKEQFAKAHCIEGLENCFLQVPRRFTHKDEEKWTSSQTGTRWCQLLRGPSRGL